MIFSQLSKNTKMSILRAMNTILENKIEIKYQNHQTGIITIQAEIGKETEEVTIECTKNKMITKNLTANTNKSPITIQEAEMNNQLATNTKKHQQNNNKNTTLDRRDKATKQIIIFQGNTAIDTIDRCK